MHVAPSSCCWERRGTRWSEWRNAEYCVELTIDAPLGPLDTIRNVGGAGAGQVRRLQGLVHTTRGASRGRGWSLGHRGTVAGRSGRFKPQCGDQGFGGLPANPLDGHEFRDGNRPADGHVPEMVVDGFSLFGSYPWE